MPLRLPNPRLVLSLLWSLIRNTSIAVLIAATGLMLGARFYRIDRVPKGAYVDETAVTINAICVAESGRGAYSEESYPLFFTADTGGIHSPTYVYLLSQWGSVFGFSVASIRTLAAVSSALTCLALAALVGLLAGRRTALFAFMLAAFSPWNFQFSRVAWDDHLYPLFAVAGAALFLWKKGSAAKTAAALCFVISLYSYGAARANIPLIIAGLIVLDAWRKNLRLLPLLLFFAIIGVLCIPLVESIRHGLLASRVEMLSIMSARYRSDHNLEFPWGVLELFALNLAKHFTPDFLFIHGDANLRHSTGFFGELSWPEIAGAGAALLTLPLAVLFWKKPGFAAPFSVFLFFLWGVFAGTAPAAGTWESLPHALRACGAWPYWAAFAAVGLEIVTRRIAVTLPLLAAGSAVFVMQFLSAYFNHYPVRSEPWFDYEQQVAAREASANNDWDNPILRQLNESNYRYYANVYGGIRCEETRRRYETLASSFAPAPEESSSQ